MEQRGLLGKMQNLKLAIDEMGGGEEKERKI